MAQGRARGGHAPEVEQGFTGQAVGSLLNQRRRDASTRAAPARSRTAAAVAWVGRVEGEPAAGRVGASSETGFTSPLPGL